MLPTCASDLFYLFKLFKVSIAKQNNAIDSIINYITNILCIFNCCLDVKLALASNLALKGFQNDISTIFVL